MSNALIIGVDHGYAAMKTAHCAFPTGLVEYEYEPFTRQGVLEYGGRFYVVGSGRQPLQKDKTLTEDYYLLTLAAIAKELAYRNAGHAAFVHLAAGLPLTSFGRDKKKFRAYLLRDGRPVFFRFKGTAYTVTITEVSLFPQGYAALLTQPELLDEPSVILADIGGWTVDLMRLDNRIPNAATCRSLELGMIRCLDEIAEQIRRRLGLSMTAAQIESILRSEVSSMDDQAKQIIHREADSYVHRLLSAITESGLDARAMPAVFLGGGAALLKRHVSATDGLCRPVILDDVCLNAKGYRVEMVSPKLTYAELPKLQECVRRVRKAGAKVNGSCGIHVHVDASNHNRQSLKNLIGIMYSKEDILFKALQVNEARAGRWCQKVREPMLKKARELSADETSDLALLENIWYEGEIGKSEHYNWTRYYALNLHSVFYRGTVEWRCFNSTLHAGKVAAYVNLCLAISAQAIAQRSTVMKKTHSDNELFTFRVWLVRLGLNGDEFKHTRDHLLAHLEGDRAWRRDKDSYEVNRRKKKEREKER